MNGHAEDGPDPAAWGDALSRLVSAGLAAASEAVHEVGGRPGGSPEDDWRGGAAWRGGWPGDRGWNHGGEHAQRADDGPGGGHRADPGVGSVRHLRDAACGPSSSDSTGNDDPGTGAGGARHGGRNGEHGRDFGPGRHGGRHGHGRPGGRGGNPWDQFGGWSGLGRLFGPGPFPGRPGRPGWPHGGGGRRRMGRGDVRAAALFLLAEEPMHGYQIIQEISSRTDGAWRPSPGSVYPALQLLEDEGLITMAHTEGRRMASLTTAGREYVDAHAADLAKVWTTATEGEATAGGTAADSKEAFAQLAFAAVQVFRTGSHDQIEAARAVITEARRKLYLILADVDADADAEAEFGAEADAAGTPGGDADDDPNATAATDADDARDVRGEAGANASSPDGELGTDR